LCICRRKQRSLMSIDQPPKRKQITSSPPFSLLSQKLFFKTIVTQSLAIYIVGGRRRERQRRWKKKRDGLFGKKTEPTQRCTCKHILYRSCYNIHRMAVATSSSAHPSLTIVYRTNSIMCPIL
jgi:hypothetical protein